MDKIRKLYDMTEEELRDMADREWERAFRSGSNVNQVETLLTCLICVARVEQIRNNMRHDR